MENRQTVDSWETWIEAVKGIVDEHMMSIGHTYGYGDLADVAGWVEDDVSLAFMQGIAPLDVALDAIDTLVAATVPDPDDGLKCPECKADTLQGEAAPGMAGWSSPIVTVGCTTCGWTDTQEYAIPNAVS